MCLTETKYSLIRFYLVESKRNLEFLKEKLIEKLRPKSYESEVEYWISSLDLIVNCLYGCNNDYDGLLDLSSAIEEIKSEMSNFLTLLKKFKTDEIRYLTKAWKNCKSAEEVLND